jgi:hypothetical protein
MQNEKIHWKKEVGEESNIKFYFLLNIDLIQPVKMIGTS